MADDHATDLGASAGARTTKRRGRMSATKRLALAELAPTWTIVPASPVTARALADTFGRDASRLLDIGVGNGDASLAYADAHPGQDVVAVELHRPGIVNLLRRLDAHADTSPATNVRVVEADATVLLAAVECGTFRHIRVLFPDPWPKRRHLDRRMIDVMFIRQVADLLPPGGTLHLATDWEDYAHQMRAALVADERLIPQVDVEGATFSASIEPGHGGGPSWRSHRPPRPVTAYERRGLDAGRPIIDLLATKAP